MNDTLAYALLALAEAKAGMSGTDSIVLGVMYIIELAVDVVALVMIVVLLIQLFK